MTTPIGNNTIDFKTRKKKWSDAILRIPPLIQWTIDDVCLFSSLMQGNYSSLTETNRGVCYEYVSDSWKLISSSWLQNLIQLSWTSIQKKKKRLHIYIIDNHNHAFYCRYKSYREWILQRRSHLIHIDQHSDLNTLSLQGTKQSNMISKNMSLSDIANYTNEVLDIASFIKPAKECGLISDYEMILTEYSLLQPYNFTSLQPWTILDIDLDFRAPEMSIEHYSQTIHRVKKLISLPQIQCITIATSPTYIDQKRALEILRDILQ